MNSDRARTVQTNDIVDHTRIKDFQDKIRRRGGVPTAFLVVAFVVQIPSGNQGCLRRTAQVTFFLDCRPLFGYIKLGKPR